MKRDINSLKEGDKIAKYGIISNMIFVSCDSRFVTMRDKNGNEKTVYRELFEKNAVFEETEKETESLWRPIEEAPKDGTFVLCCIKDRPFIPGVAAYVDGKWQDLEMLEDDDIDDVSYEPDLFMLLEAHVSGESYKSGYACKV